MRNSIPKLPDGCTYGVWYNVTHFPHNGRSYNIDLLYRYYSAEHDKMMLRPDLTHDEETNHYGIDILMTDAVDNRNKRLVGFRFREPFDHPDYEFSLARPTKDK